MASDAAKLPLELPPDPSLPDYPLRLNLYLERQFRLLRQQTGPVGATGATGPAGSAGTLGLTGTPNTLVKIGADGASLVSSTVTDINAVVTAPLLSTTALSIFEGSGATMGRAVLIAGTYTVNTTQVVANCRIFLTTQALGTVALPKALAVTSRVIGTSFTITSADATDTSTVAWCILAAAA